MADPHLPRALREYGGFAPPAAPRPPNPVTDPRPSKTGPPKSMAMASATAATRTPTAMTTDAAIPNPPELAGEFAGREVVVGICGGIAAYKVCSVVSALVQRGCGVTCVMTRSAGKFVAPLTFEALSGRKVLRSLWRSEEHTSELQSH